MASLASLGLGALTLTPAFDPAVTEYTASTTNNSNTITAAGAAGCTVDITVNVDPHTSGAAAEWELGENTVAVKVQNGPKSRIYTVTVTKLEV